MSGLSGVIDRDSRPSPAKMVPKVKYLRSSHLSGWSVTRDRFSGWGGSSARGCWESPRDGLHGVASLPGQMSAGQAVSRAGPFPSGLCRLTSILVSVWMGSGDP